MLCSFANRLTISAFVAILCLTALGVMTGSRPAASEGLSASEEFLVSDFDARPLSLSEKRIVQMALAMEGDYNGLVDGAWGRRSQTALEAYVTRNFSDIPRYFHVAVLVSGFAREFLEDGWAEFYEQQFGVTFLFPQDLMREKERGSRFIRYEGTQGLLAVSIERHGGAELAELHQSGLRRFGPPRGEVYQLRKSHRWVTSFKDRDGDYWYVRTEPVKGALTTVSILADPGNRNVLNAISTSILPGQASLLRPEEDGVLLSVIDMAARAMGEDNTPPTRESAGGYGSGVMISDQGHILTNYHVVEGCRNLSANGASVMIDKVSEEDDLALLSPAGEFSLLVGRPTASFAYEAAELNQDITVAGFPLGGVLGGLNITRGSVSSRRGPGGNPGLFQITAAIQPGNSGGPILDSSGRLVGLVVSKMNDKVFADASGVLPQDISFGISRDAVADFVSGVPGIVGQGWFGGITAAAELSNTELARLAEAVTYIIECE